MIKLLAAAMILNGCICLGNRPLIILKKRLCFLNDLIKMLENIKYSMNCFSPTLSQLFSNISLDKSSSAYPFLQEIQGIFRTGQTQSFESAWNCAIENNLKTLTTEEKDQMMYLGNILGKYFLEDEIQELNNTINLLNDGYTCTQRKYKEVHNLYLTYGGAIGLLMIIILI